jgi:broad specificity phosphatase PhoE
MIAKHDIADFFFIRHAPVEKRKGHLPAYDAAITKGPFDLAPLIANLPKQAVWHVSPLQRAQQTATLFKGYLNPVSQIIQPALAEQNFGAWHGQPINGIWQQINTEPKHNWSFIMHNLRPPNGESFDDQMARVKRWCELQEQKQLSTSQIVFAHAGTIRAVAAHMLGLSAVKAQSINVPNFGCLHASLMIASKANKNHGGAWQIHKLN